MHKRILRRKRVLAVGVTLACLMALLIPTALATQPGEITLTVKQAFSNPGISDDTFHYKLAPKLASNPMPAGSGADGYTFSITGTNDAQLGPILFNEPGVYAYEISCITASRPGYTCAHETYRLEIFVERSLAFTVVIYKEDGSKVSDIKYEHTYRPLPSDPSAMVDPPIVKTVSGNPAKDSAFIFQLTAKNPSGPLPAGSADGVKTLQIIGPGQGSFGTWSYTAEGTYYYTVSEVNSGVSGYTYDTTVYTITDAVKAADGQLAVTRVITNGANKQVSSLSFINTYTPPPGNGKGGSGKPGPITGDETQIALYITLFCVAGIVALGSAAWLLISRQCRRRNRNESEA